jgi:AGZA family xanthine/uracil permease-like MFS transporter
MAGAEPQTRGESGFLERYFGLSERGTTPRREVLAGLTTFVVMAYIIFVNPSILAFSGVKDLEPLGLPVSETATGTCLVAGVMTIAMGLFANYPFALAPGLGINAFVAFTLVAGMKLSWEQAMGVIFYEGVIIAALVLTNVRAWVMEAIPVSLKRAIGVGIGLFIAVIGAAQAGFIKAGQATPLTYGSVTSPQALVAAFGLVVTAVLLLKKVRGALLIGMVVATAAGIWPGLSKLPAAGAMAVIPTLPPIGRIDFGVILDAALLPAIFAVLLSDFFDTMGTVVAVGGEAKLLDAGHRLPRLNRVLFVDSLAAVAGGLCRTSSATTYIESAAGVAEGGRTGLTAVVTGVLFLLALPLAPLAAIVPSAATAPALLIVGFLMMSVVREIPWDEPVEALPAFATMLFIPLTYSITRGIGYGFILYVVLKTLTGKWRDVHPLLYVVSAAFVLEFVFRPI